ncbi:hypothetical protein niasHS_005349 [Heterodera schachtii]|uniref:Small acidic protein-like domain-containing protein n=2 Tax=Heterodera TaxID=34509 RepID=A0ABD2J962_HETSC
MSNRTGDNDNVEHHRSAVKNSQSSAASARDSRRGDDHRRDGQNPRASDQRRSDAERYHHHHDTNSYHRRRSMGNDDQLRRTDRRADNRWAGRERDEPQQQRPKRRDRPAFTEEEADQEPVDPNRPSWQNTKVRKHAEMLKERKLLWKGKGGASGEEQREAGEATMTTTTEPTGDDSKPVFGTELATERKEKQLEHKWQSMIAATAQDTQQMDKFQRLMGMKKGAVAAAADPPAHSQQQQQQDEAESAAAVQGPAEAAPSTLNNAELSRERMRQMELQRGLNQQFELARQSHHGGRGRGLGSF